MKNYPVKVSLVGREKSGQDFEWKEEDMKEWTSTNTQEYVAGHVAQLVEYL